MNLTADLKERFWAKVAVGRLCWLWTAARSKKGYGRFAVGRQNRHAHRVAYQLANGAFPATLHVLHRCDNPACVRPDHLFLGTNDDNVRDAVAKGRAALRGRKRDTCKQGHPLAAGNLYYRSTGKRQCRLCVLEARRRYLARRAGT